MTNTICLDEKYSTTKLVTQGKLNIINNPEDKFETVLFLPEGENRKGEGGLRTKGYFKKSFDDKPLISIITVVYNGEKYIEETIQSVINQTYDNVEYIIIDGGSTDGTLDIIKKYEDRIDYWVNEINKQICCDENRTVFISQPYYIDYGIDEEYWINTFLAIMNNLGLNSLEIKFHQRDTDSFKSKILKRGFREYTGNLEDAGIFYGFFSTLLFELALDGKKVFSLFEEIKHFFPAGYLKFIEFIANELNIKLNGHDLWSLTCNDFYSLTNKVFK